MRVYAVQFDIAWEDKATNLAHARELVEGASPAPGSLVVLPEMFATGFSMNAASICEPPGGPTTRFLRDVATMHGVYVIAGVATEHADGRRVNEALVIGPGGSELGRYAKTHPFTYGGETEHYAAGDKTLTVDCGGFRCAPMVCYDLRFPETFREAVREGAALFAVIANWPEPRAAHWTALLRARAIENQAYVVGVNRCGADPNCSYAGSSLIIDAMGEILAEAGSAEGVLEAELDLQTLNEYRERFPALKDM